ncbi:MAG: DNA-binding protein, partial [Planctomycetota bacterium]
SDLEISGLEIKDDDADDISLDSLVTDGSSIELGSELPEASGSDINLIADEGDGLGSDVKLVAGQQSSADLLLMDSEELRLADGPVLSHDSAELDLAIEPKPGSTGPVEGKSDDLLGSPAAAIPESDADLLAALDSGSGVGGSDILASDDSDKPLVGESSDLELNISESGSLDRPMDKNQSSGSVLSELDLLSGTGSDASGSNVLGTPGESDINLSVGSGSLAGISGIDDALENDDDLIISSDDDDDLMLSSVDGDVSITGDSGVNLVSPTDSGLSLEGEPLDLAGGSSISALDLGAELDLGGSGSGGSGSGRLQSPSDGGSGSLVDFAADEEFQLSPSAIGGIEVDDDSGSQVIEVEDSAQFGQGVDFGAGGDVAVSEEVFAAEPAAEEGVAVAVEEDEVVAVVDTQPDPGATVVVQYQEPPFDIFTMCILAMILVVMSLAGMLMTDLACNMWAFNEQTPPVSGLGNALLDSFGMGP